jgi:MraZ protein
LQGAIKVAAAVFKGQATSALDSKGRFSLPVLFRTVLAQTCDTPALVQLRADPERPYLSLFGDQMLSVFQTEIDEKARISATRGEEFDREMADADFFGSIEEASIDSGGRFTLPAKLRDPYGIGDGAFLIGAGRLVQVWSPERFLTSGTKNSLHLAACEQFLAELAAKRGGKA